MSFSDCHKLTILHFFTLFFTKFNWILAKSFNKTIKFDLLQIREKKPVRHSLAYNTRRPDGEGDLAKVRNSEFLQHPQYFFLRKKLGFANQNVFECQSVSTCFVLPWFEGNFALFSVNLIRKFVPPYWQKMCGRIFLLQFDCWFQPIQLQCLKYEENFFKSLKL